MNISPTYAGDGAFSGKPAGGGLDREAALLQEAMANRQISKNADAQAKAKALEELSKLLDVRAENITANMNVRMGLMADSMDKLVEALVSVAEQFQEVGERFEKAEIRLTQLESDIMTLANALPADALTGPTNTGSGRTPIEAYLAQR